MKLFIGVFLVQLALMVPTFAADDIEATGKIMWSVATNIDADLFEMFVFQFRSRDGKHTNYSSYSHNSLISRGSDFIGKTEKGGVQILTVPAGDWEMYGYAMTGRSSTLDFTTFYPKRAFSVPITVIPGGTIYIGSYRAVWTGGKDDLGRDIVTGGYFIVSDQSGRDIAVAKKKDAAVGDVEDKIPDYASLGLPFFQPAPAANSQKTPIVFRIRERLVDPNWSPGSDDKEPRRLSRRGSEYSKL